MVPTLLAVAATPATAHAPPGQGLDRFALTCNGATVDVVTARGEGATGWINGQHVVVLSFTISGPDGTDTFTLGQKTGLEATLTCTETEGPFTITVIAAPVPPQP